MSAELTKYEDCMNELNELKDLILSMKNNCKYLGKDPDGAVVNSFELGYDASLAFARAMSHVDAIKSFLKERTEPQKSNEAAELLTWLDEHPETTNKLAVITTKSGTNIQLWNKEPYPIRNGTKKKQAQAGYTIEELSKEWNAYVFASKCNTVELPNDDGKSAGFHSFIHSFIDFLLTPHTVFYADGNIYAVNFYDKKE